jgi:hypothetical protein
VDYFERRATLVIAVNAFDGGWPASEPVALAVADDARLRRPRPWLGWDAVTLLDRALLDAHRSS